MPCTGTPRTHCSVRRQAELPLSQMTHRTMAAVLDAAPRVPTPVLTASRVLHEGRWSQGIARSGGRSVRSSASCSDAYQAAVAVAERAMVVNPIDNADATPRARHGRAVSADKRTNENLT
jgi:hypothetical protein